MELFICFLFIYPSCIYYLVSKMSGKVFAILVAGILVGAVFGIAGYKWYESGQEVETPSWTPTEEVPTHVATLDIVQNTSELNFTTAIDANGSVASDAEDTALITIWNNDTIDATNVEVSLVNDINGREGLPSALKVDEFEVYVKVSTGYLTKTYYLFRDGEYNSNGGLDLGTIETDSNVQITLGVKVLEADTDTFSDGKSYDMTLYILQGDNAYDSVDFTVLT